MQREIERLRRDYEYRGNSLAEAGAEIERLRAALEKYGGHLEGCPFKGECTCGLKELIGRM
jgi:hypothetical protein